jgi:hypothetical protein
VAGKLGGRGVISAVRSGRLFYVTDSASCRRILVDTGSAFSLMPWQSESPPTGPCLTGGVSPVGVRSLLPSLWTVSRGGGTSCWRQSASPFWGPTSFDTMGCW